MYSYVVAWFQAGPLPWLALLVPRPGLLYGVATFVAGFLFVRRAARAGIQVEGALEALLATLVGVLIGTRFFYLVTRTRFWEMGVLELIDTSKGTASWGAYLGGVIGLVSYALWQRIAPLRLTDIACSVAAMPDLIGRWNCWLAGDDYGRVTALGWGIRYPKGSMPWREHLRQGLITASDPWSLPVHPNQLVLGAAGLVVFLVVSRYWSTHRDQYGRTTALYFVLYGATRFPVEFLRAPAAGGATGLLSHSQYMCLACIAAGMLLWWRLADRTTAGPVARASGTGNRDRQRA
jgi:phosphatidylglycerol:prolipoprotein diacylglycerol transferase